jgi:TRAP-type C4-dicarboxylate transport system permease small subunit
MERAVDLVAQAFALLGGAVVCGIALVASWSILGRNLLDQPLLGDVELTVLGMIIAVSAFVPICQWRGANIIVDFFTTGTSARTRRRLDGLGNLAVAGMLFLLAWRGAVAAAAMRETRSMTMLLEIPEWIAYAATVPPIATGAAIALYMAARDLRAA